MYPKVPMLKALVSIVWDHQKSVTLQQTEFKEEEEEKLCSENQLDIAKFKASNILEINGPEDEDEDLDPIQFTTTFPTYTINNKDYVLLNDIQHLFDLREDYALAILAEWS